MPTPQEQFWSTAFGDEYTTRTTRDWKTRVPFWRDILDKTKARSILEVGCNAGLNLTAIRSIDPMLALWGCDINKAALAKATENGHSVVAQSIFDLDTTWPPKSFDLTFTCGVLIHVAPADIERAMQSIIAASRRWVLAVEYEADEEQEVEYRGHAERLWKRPFGIMYEVMGLKMVAQGEAPEDAFDRCHFWLLERT